VVLTKRNELEHRFIAKQILNRDLNRNEVVHHINGNKTDNNINNLCLMNSEKHEFFHSWLTWKKNKSGKYPSIQEQKRVLETEYGGKLLEEYQRAIVKPNKEANSELKKDIIDAPESNEAKLTSIQNQFDVEFKRKLLIELKKLRKDLALERDLPVYMIFDNKTLIEISEKMPETDSELLQIRGVGSGKLKMYGPYFLDLMIKIKNEDKQNKRTKSDSA
jgi:superfamily II DNA helicase RecQ